MKTQKHLLALAVCGLMMATGAAYADASAMTTNPGSTAGTQGTGGVVNFTGEITDTSCEITSDSKDINVDLGKWARTYFADNKTESTQTEFHVKVEKCPEDVKTVAVLFDGDKDVNDPTLLKLTDGGAEGVGVKLYEDDRATQINIGSVSKAQDVKTTGEGDDATGSADLAFFAAYKANGQDVKVGAANAVSNFVMIYN